MCDDEFLLGDDWLVAPVVQAGQTSRAIFFPPGRWRDYWTGEVLEGGRVVEAYPAPLEKLPLFERLG